MQYYSPTVYIIIANCGLLLVAYGYVWLCMVMYGYVRYICTVMYGYVWLRSHQIAIKCELII